jgi:NAD(P)H dehydrogenase (quinone)
MKVLLVYYSTYGNAYRMANLVAEGVKEIPGVQPAVRTVPELIPKSVINSREDMKAAREMWGGPVSADSSVA